MAFHNFRVKVNIHVAPVIVMITACLFCSCRSSKVAESYEHDMAIKADSVARDSINVHTWACDSLEENETLEKDIVHIIYDTDKMDSAGNCPVKEIIVDRSKVNTTTVSKKDQESEEIKVNKVIKIDSVTTSTKHAKVVNRKIRFSFYACVGIFAILLLFYVGYKKFGWRLVS